MKYKYHIITYGCQMNKNDSERMEAVFFDMGMKKAKDEYDADIIIINSCSVRESAELRVYSKINNLKKVKEKKPDLIIAISGCMVGRDHDKKIRKKMLGVDLFFSNDEMVYLSRLLHNLNPKLIELGDYKGNYLSILPETKNKFQAFVSIQTGCDQFCTYCVVPYARGREVNRPVKEILSESRDLVKNGTIQITLLGQIVNHYIAPDPENFSQNNPYQKNDFAKLLWELNQIVGLGRIHFTAPHPAYVDDEMIDALTLPKQIRFLHLPVQSGSNEILQKMNRKHDRKFFIDIIKKIKEKNPDMAIGTDIIVGFCSENKKDFADTVDLYRQCEFDISYTAQYSDRTGTVAHKNLVDGVNREEKKSRWQELQKLMESITYKKNKKLKNTLNEVLVEKYEKGYCFGQSNNMKLTKFPSKKDLTGQLIKVKIIEPKLWILEAKMI